MNTKIFVWTFLFICLVAVFSRCYSTMDADENYSDGIFATLANVVPTERGSAVAAVSTRNFYDSDFGRRSVKLFAEKKELAATIQQLLVEGHHFSGIYIPEISGSETMSFLYGEKCADLNELDIMLEKCGFICEWVGTEEHPVLKLSNDAFFAQISPNIFLLTQNEKAPVDEYFSLQKRELGMSEEGLRELQKVMKKSFFYADLEPKAFIGELKIKRDEKLIGYITLSDEDPNSVIKCLSAGEFAIDVVRARFPATASALEKAIILKGEGRELHVQVDMDIEVAEAMAIFFLSEGQSDSSL